MKKYAVIIALFVLLGIGCRHTKKHDTKPEGGEQPTEQATQQPEKPAEEPSPQTAVPRPISRPTPPPVSHPEEIAPPRPAEHFVPQAPGWRIARVSVPGNYVALTFDDGPSASVTPKVLDILKRHHVRATFFVLGENVVRNKGIVARAAAEGHEIASHSWNHPNLSKMSQAQVISQMDRTAAAIREATGSEPALMRPPYGATNRTLGGMLMARYGTPSVLWDVDTVDWRHPGVNVVIRRAVGGAHNGSIILLHDIHASTLAAVEGVVEGLKARGFQLVTVSELIRMGREAAGEAADKVESPGQGTIGGADSMANTLPPSDEGVPLPNTPEPQPTPPPSPQPDPQPDPEAPAPSQPSQGSAVTSTAAPTAPGQTNKGTSQQKNAPTDAPSAA